MTPQLHPSHDFNPPLFFSTFTLKVSATFSSVRLLWATNDPPFSLQAATNLPSANWIAALPLPVVSGTNNVVTNAITGSQQFYRLSNP
jgi:hypothetical protein